MSIFNYSDNIMVGNEQVSAVIIDGVSVWSAKPSKITNFNASNNQYQAITCTWSVASSPRPITYNLINNSSGAVIARNVTSGYVYNVGTGTYNLRVDAVTDIGTTPSNVNSGTSLARPTGSKEFTSSGTWTVPNGVVSVTLCMIGGGGGGANSYTSGKFGGGYAGQIKSQVVAVTPGSSITVTVGNGGGVKSGSGYTGGSSKFGSITASGGRGGGESNYTYRGLGATRPSNCYGTYRDGRGSSSDNRFNGGQAGFANGGDDGQAHSGGPHHGSRGSGGGQGDSRSGGPGSGGKGVVRISWGAGSKKIIINTVKYIADINNPAILIGYLVNGKHSITFGSGDRYEVDVNEWITQGNVPDEAFSQDELLAEPPVFTDTTQNKG